MSVWRASCIMLLAGRTIFRTGDVETIQQLYYSVTLRNVLATIVAAEKQYVLLVQCVFVALVMQRAMRMRRIVCGLLGSTIFYPRFLIHSAICETKKQKVLNTECMF